MSKPDKVLTAEEHAKHVSLGTKDSNRVDLLDHGYLRLVDTWGSDRQIIESARMSTDKGFLGWGPHIKGFGADGSEIPLTAWQQEQIRDGNSAKVMEATKVVRWEPGSAGDEKLLRFLYEKKHSTPFEFAGLTIEVQAPIMVFREWHRHRTQSFSEMSARYVEIPELFYVPSAERLAAGGQSKTNKQASGATLDPVVVENARGIIRDQCQEAFKTYRALLANGVAKELARLVLPVNMYSRMRATTDLRNWLAFLTLRMAPGAQWEIRQFANAVGDMIAEYFPRTWALFAEAVPP